MKQELTEISYKNIRKYNHLDFKQIYNITKQLWKDEFEMTLNLQNIIYEFLVKYYLYDNELNFVYDNDGIIKSFMLLHKKEEFNDISLYFNEKINKLTKEEQNFAKRYLEYLEYNSNMVYEIMPENSLYLSLIASIQKGTGKLLIDYLNKYCKDNNIEQYYFWTDETCNYSFYEKNGFILKKEYNVDFFGRNIKTFIYSNK